MNLSWLDDIVQGTFKTRLTLFVATSNVTAILFLASPRMRVTSFGISISIGSRN